MTGCVMWWRQKVRGARTCQLSQQQLAAAAARQQILNWLFLLTLLCIISLSINQTSEKTQHRRLELVFVTHKQLTQSESN